MRIFILSIIICQFLSIFTEMNTFSTHFHHFMPIQSLIRLISSHFLAISPISSHLSLHHSHFLSFFNSHMRIIRFSYDAHVHGERFQLSTANPTLDFLNPRLSQPSTFSSIVGLDFYSTVHPFSRKGNYAERLNQNHSSLFTHISVSRPSLSKSG